MIKVSIIGSGNVAQHLITALKKFKIQVLNWNSCKCTLEENLTHLLDLNQIATRIEDLSEVDLYIIAVSDDAIASVSKQLIFKIDL
jgi:predicted dinucleotide-utilizing enzyme